MLDDTTDYIQEINNVVKTKVAETKKQSKKIDISFLKRYLG